MEKSRQYQLAFAGGVAFIVLVDVLRKWRIRKGVMKKINWKKAECRKAFDEVIEQFKESNLTEEEVLKIVQLSFSELQQQLQDGTLKAVQVLQAYQVYALKANERLNAITEPLLTAKEMAEKLDSQNEKKGILHGIPISVKESFDIKSLDTTAGLSRYLGKPRPEDAALVKVLKDQGAIPFIRTNIPQTMMIYECSNPIYGQTVNPFDPTRTPGGSTGGEAALIGAKASILGSTSEVKKQLEKMTQDFNYGSQKMTAVIKGKDVKAALFSFVDELRIMHYCRKGTISLSKGQMQVSGTVGPMARDFDGLVAGTKVLLSDLHFKLDPSIPPMKFRDEIFNSKQSLRIGFYVNDGYIPAVPSCRRAVMLAKKALEAMGHTVVDFKPPKVAYIYPKLYLGTVMGDKGLNYSSKLQGDIVDPIIKVLMAPSKFPNFAIWLLSWLAQFLTKDEVIGNSLRARMGVKSVHDWFLHAIKIQQYKEEFLSAWRAEDLDAVICPPFAMTAVPLGTVSKVIGAGSYSMLYNLLNYPAGVLPVTKVMADDVKDLHDYPSTTVPLKLIKQYSARSEGLPVGVQCVSLPFGEELVLRVMKEVETGLKLLKD